MPVWKQAPILLSLAILVCATPVPTHAQDERLVLAFYYAWFDQSTWQKPLSDQPSAPYLSTDPVAIERHVIWAQQAGIDAFVQSWYGPQTESNQTEPNFSMLLNISSQKGFAAAVDFEVGSPFFHSESDVIGALEYLLGVHAAHPAYLRVGGKPVIFFWHHERYPVETWVSIRNAVDPQRSSIWISEGVNLDYLGPFDGNHLYSVAWDSQPQEVLERWGQRVRDWSAENSTFRYWVATVIPGYNDYATGRANAFIRDRAGGDYYRLCWQGATQSAADMVVITSFNEWLEGTQIEPGVGYGDMYLNLTQELGSQYRSATQPLAPNAQPSANDLSLNAPPSPLASPLASPTPSASPTPVPSATARSTPTPSLSPVPPPSIIPSPSPTATASPASTAVPSPTPAPHRTLIPASTTAASRSPGRFFRNYSGVFVGALGLALIATALLSASDSRTGKN